MRENCKVGCVSRKVVLDKRSLNREQPVTKALKFPSSTRKIPPPPPPPPPPSELEWILREGVHAERRGDRYVCRIP